MSLKLYKYRSCRSDEAFEHLKDIILEGKIWASCPTQFNDPYDCFPSFENSKDEEQIKAFVDDLIRKRGERNARKNRRFYFNKAMNDAKFEKRRKFIEGEWGNIVKESSVVCFSEDPSNVLMWSHYSDNHKGLSLEFLFDNDYVESIKISRFKYSENRVVCPLFCSNETFLKKAEEFMVKKFNDWEYEKEYRIFTEIQKSKNFGKGELVQIPKESIKRIRLGVKASPDLERKIRELVSENNLQISIERVKLGRLKYRVNV